MTVQVALIAGVNVAALAVIAALAMRWRRRAARQGQDALARLRESEARFRGLVDKIPGVVFQRLVTPDGVSRITFISPDVQALYGPDITPERALADPTFLRNMFHPDDRARLDVLRDAAYRRLSLLEAETRIVTSDDRVKWVHVLSQPRPQPGGNVLWDGLIIDITARKEAEQARALLEGQLRQAQKMEAVGQLTGGVAHDFNNLLAIILGNVELLDERMAAERKGERELLATIRRASERGAALTQRLLAFSRQQPLQPSDLDLNRIVGDLDDLLRRTLGESIEILTTCASDLSPALADRSQIEEVLLNLAVNARDAMPDGGKLTIETANVVLDDSYAASNLDVAPGSYVMLAVSDTGSGMTREVMERAFEPFFTTKGVGKGTGLGLSMVFGFAKQSGGHVKIYSEVGHGTTVKLYLPRGRGKAEAVPESGELPMRPTSGRHILLVEDDADVRTMAAAMLARLGYSVVEAGDGPAALVALDAMTQVDLLFTDVVLPRGMNGRTLAEEAVRRRPGLKVLFTSGYTQNSIVHHGRLDEGVELIVKPYRSADLARKIAAILTSD